MSSTISSDVIVLKNLVLNSQYFLTYYPFLSKDIFVDKSYKSIYDIIDEYYKKYNEQPNLSVIKNELKESSLNEMDKQKVSELFDYIENNTDKLSDEYLKDVTINFIKLENYRNCLLSAAVKLNKNELDLSLPEKVEKIYGFNIDEHIGETLNEYEERWEHYNEKEDKIPFLIDIFNKVTDGGFSRKTLNCFMSDKTGGFKSGTMCSLSSDYIRQGYNVLYLSFEMSEDKVLERIDANLLDTNINDIISMGKDRYLEEMNNICKKYSGKLYVKQYPTAQCTVLQVKQLLEDLKLKKLFIPDVICFDYIGIMASSRYKSEQEYVVLKAISEEVRGLCIEYNCVGITAAQSNRSGLNSVETALGLSSIAGSYGMSYGMDTMFGIQSLSEKHKNYNIRLAYQQLKNRYSDINDMKTIILGVNKAKMKIYDISDENDLDTQKEITDSESNDFQKKIYYQSGKNKTKNLFDNMIKKSGVNI